jgi:hypothetical protein
MFGLENSANNFGASAGLLANTLANRPVQAALGTIFIGTNNLIIYRYNGNSWDIIGGGGFAGATNGLNFNGGLVRLGGALINDTQIVTNLNKIDFYASSTSTAQFKVTNDAAISELACFTSISSFNDGGVYLGNFEDRGTIQSKSFATQTPTELRINYDGGSIQLGNGMFGMMLDDGTPKIQTTYGNLIKGLELNFDVNSYSLGDIDVGSNGTLIRIDDFNEAIRTYNQSSILGLDLNFVNNTFALGDIFYIINGTSITIDDNNQIIKTNNQGNEIGLKLDYVNNIFYLGDYNDINNGTALVVNEAGNRIATTCSLGSLGFVVEFTSGVSGLGDFYNIFNGYNIKIDDTLGELRFEGANLQSNTSGGNSGEHLVIWLNGINYKIKLENP